LVEAILRSLWPNERLFFEVYGHTFQRYPTTAQLLDGIVDSCASQSLSSAPPAGSPERSR
jgi:hypothetical protein